eukprot:TRINITY_DN8787_c0_g2_i1.p2 TRINITY_DN8787_c0_g2~~TRINITY_DN8787_c0_g2_i1.p2  ORF type:complete len:262 (+),score=117.87 TRINITY_DN8787_c0_g2_i1:174-959(+)
MPSGGRVRGVSFKQEYSKNAPGPSAFQRFKQKVTGKSTQRARAPSMIAEPNKMMLPPQAKEDQGRLCVVLDLDETLIYAREGPLYARPGLDEFLEMLHEKCEPVVWTAGVKAYAQAVVRNIDKKNVIRHCVYRHKKWFSGCAGYNKDLSLLGRDMDRLLILENTPDCVRGNEANGVVIADYEGNTLFRDPTLYAIKDLILDLLEKMEGGMTVPEYVKSTEYLEYQQILTDVGDTMGVFTLDAYNFAEQKAKRVNKDLPANK